MAPFNWDDIDTNVNPALTDLNQYNSGNYDVSLNPLGLAGGGHIQNFPAALVDIATVANAFPEFADLVSGYADAAAASAVTAAAAAANLSGTSSSSVALSTGSKSFTTQAGKTWPVGSTLLLTSNANPTTHWMVIVVTDYTGTTLQGTSLLFSGSGSRADWTIRSSGYPVRGAGIAYLWDTNTSSAPSDPGTGELRLNAAPGSASALYISETDFDGNAMSALLSSWGVASGSIKGRLYVSSITQRTNFVIFDITSTGTDNGTWQTFSITPVTSGGSMINGALVSLMFIASGAAGATGATGPSYAATSTTSFAIGTGSKAFTTQAGLAYLAGARVRIADSATPASNWMEGVVTAYSSTTLTVLVDATSGSGTIASWNINLAGQTGATGSTGVTGDDAGFEFIFNSATSGDPGTGKFLFNNATFASATALHISETDNNTNAMADFFAAIDNGTGTNKVLVYAIKQNGAAYFSFYITSVLSDAGAYDTFSISPISTVGAISNNDTFHLIFVPLTKGDTGATGVAGPTTALTWVFDDATASADPGTNEFRLNNATVASVTEVYIDDLGVDSSDLSAFLEAADSSTTTGDKGTLFITQANDPQKYAAFTIVSVADQTGWFIFTVSGGVGPGGFTLGEECALAFYKTGDAGAGSGDVVGPASATDNALALFDSTTGKLIKNSAVQQTTGVLAPTTTDTVALGSTTKMWSDLFMAAGATFNLDNGNWVATHSSGILTVGTGDLRVTNAGTNTGSVVTVGGAQTLTNKTLSSPAIATPTGLLKSDVGLGNVDNTSDADKPVSTAQHAINMIKRAIVVRAATTANLPDISTALNNGDTIDGVTLATDDLVLVKDQTSTALNGIYVVGVTPTRHVDFNVFNELPGTVAFVKGGGTVNAGSAWICTSVPGGTIDNDPLDFVRFGAQFPATTVDNTVPRFDDVSGKLQTSGVSISDSDVLSAADFSGALTSATGLPLSTGVTGTLPVANGGTGQTTEAEAIGELIQALTADTTPDISADYLATYDASTDTGKKVLLSTLVRDRLSANRTYYVRTDGNDSNTGTVDTAGGAWLTWQYAVNWIIANLDFSGYTVTLQCGGSGAGRNFSFTNITINNWTGGGQLTLKGDATTPTNVQLSGSNGCINDNHSYAQLFIEGFKLVSATANDCLLVSGGGSTRIQNVDWGTAARCHMWASNGWIYIAGTNTISGDALSHMRTFTANGVIEYTASTTVSASRAISPFVHVSGCGVVTAWGTWTNPSNNTGERISCELNGVINTFGAGTAYFPGSAYTAPTTGGQYG